MSSSSSLCDFDDFYSNPIRSIQEPWYDYYQTMGHPLVYYAEVQPSFRRSSGAKDPNFFVKAFRWYTQEHHPSFRERSEKSENNPDITGFANWLDEKYGLYVQENQQTVQKTAVEPRKPKRLFATMKSHFTKRHLGKNNNNGARKPCNSCEYIMKPKDDSIVGSECRRLSIKAGCSDTLGQNKSVLIKSQSLNDINDSRYEYKKSIELMVTEGDANDKLEDKCSCAKTEVLATNESKNGSTYGPLPCDRGNNTECQCTVKSAKKDAQTQYESQGASAKPMAASLAFWRRSPVTPVSSAQPAQSKVTKQSEQAGQDIPKSVSQTKMSGLGVGSAVKHPAHKVKPTSDISCQCYSDAAPPAPTPTQLEKKFKECKCTTSFQDVIKVFCQNCQQNVVTTANEVKKAIEPVPQDTKPPPVPAKVVPPMRSGCICCIRVNESAQTSDTSIQLDDEVTKYPFFMKIVRADKLTTADCHQMQEKPNFKKETGLK